DDADAPAAHRVAVADRTVTHIAFADRALEPHEPRLDVDDAGREQHRSRGGAPFRASVLRPPSGEKPRLAGSFIDRKTRHGAVEDRDTEAIGMRAHRAQQVRAANPVGDSGAVAALRYLLGSRSVVIVN